MHAGNPSTQGGRNRWSSEFEASMVYRVSSRTARAIQRNCVLEKNKSKKLKKKKKIILQMIVSYHVVARN